MNEVTSFLTSKTAMAILTWGACLTTVDPIVFAIGSILFLTIWGYSWYLGFHHNFFRGGWIFPEIG